MIGFWTNKRQFFASFELFDRNFAFAGSAPIMPGFDIHNPYRLPPTEIFSAFRRAMLAEPPNKVVSYACI